jgi:hypothetical protein
MVKTSRIISMKKEGKDEPENKPPIYADQSGSLLNIGFSIRVFSPECQTERIESSSPL